MGSIAQSKTTTTTERTSSASFDSALEQKRSLEYGKASKSRALRRAELHAAHSGKDPRHTVLPRSLGDDICKVVADLHVSPYESRELNKLTENAMSYKSSNAKSAKQMAMEAMQACDMEAASSRKIKRTVVSESSSKRVAAA